jgi:dipeptidyl aminopeptidase/acylaminoacyl peptidase
MNSFFRRRIRLLLMTAVALIALAFSIAPASAQSSSSGRRAYTVEDMLRVELLGDSTISPDGKSLAYVIKRPRVAAAMHRATGLEGNDRADIWVVDGGGSPRNITRDLPGGSPEQVGAWAPSWSPDGKRLAFLATRNGPNVSAEAANVGLWLWERESGRLRQISSRGAYLNHGEPTFAWISNRELIYSAEPQGQVTRGLLDDAESAKIAAPAWQQAWYGDQPTSSLLRSGVSVDVSQRPQAELLLVSLDGQSNTLIQGAQIRAVALSSDNRQLICAVQSGVYLPKADIPLPHDTAGVYMMGEIYQPAVVDIAQRKTYRPQQNLTAVPGLARWSPDNHTVAFIGQTPGAMEGDFRVFLWTVTSGEPAAVTPAGMEPTGLVWTASGALAVYASEKSGAKPNWFVVSANQSGVRNLTQSMDAAPSELVAGASGDALFGISGGALWRIDAQRSSVERLQSVASDSTRIVWPGAPSGDPGNASPQPAPTNRIVVSSGPRSNPSLQRIELDTLHTSAISIPAPRAAFASYDARSGAAAFTLSNAEGAKIWFAGTEVADGNAFLREIAPGETRSFEYVSLDGQKLKGWMILPFNYQSGKRYPLVTWVYAGSMAHDEPDALLTQVNQSIFLNLQLLAGHGYAVMIPSMPLKPVGHPSDPYFEMTKGVLPAIDKLIEIGIADPDRLALMGHSFGGFSTYSLVTQTSRFKVALAIAGTNLLPARHGIYAGADRYTANPQERQYPEMAVIESDQGRIGGPPYRDFNRYMRNSPLAYIDRVETPLMIVHGDLDFIPIQMGEMFFNELYRQGKPAQFVRYWGESHLLESPANIRDFWQRVFDWFDSHLL